MAWNSENKYECDCGCGKTTRDMRSDFIKWRGGWFASQACIDAMIQEEQTE